MVSDTHTHTYYSADCKTDPESNILKAIANGQKYIALTDHFDHGVTYKDTFYDFDSAKRTAEILALKEKYKKEITVLNGIEIGHQPSAEVIAANAKKTESCAYDCVIGSTHLIKGLDPYIGEFFFNKTKKQAYGELLSVLAENLKVNSGYDTVGHFDYTSRYAPYEDKTFRYRDFPDEIDEFFKMMIAKGLALEFNTKTANRVPPDPDIMRRYKELGGCLLTLASDAHRPELVGLDFKRFQNYLKSFGFRYTFVFVERKPVAEKID